MAHGPAHAPDHLVGEPTMDASTSSHFPWQQWCPTDPSAFPASLEGLDTAQSFYPQEELQYNNLSPNYTTSFFSDWLGKLPMQEYPVPPSTSGSSPYPDQSSSVAESRRGSVSTAPDTRKRKRSTGERAATKSTGRGSNRKNKSQAAAKEQTQDSKSRKVQHTRASDSSSPEQAVDQYSRRVQERNRVASNKFRVKKREDARRLKADEEDMERINRDLSSCVADLTLEVYNLKIRLLQHTDCDCSLIQDYIANEAHRYIQDLGDENQHGHGRQ
ncbi:hypothetical protein ACHAPT_013096 [Fusarium lateritium]